MADTKISALPAGSTPSAGNTTFVAVQSAADVKLTDAQLAAGVKATYALSLNNTSTSDPTVNDDTGDGYTVGSRWFNSSTGALFIARSVSAGAAVWTQEAAADHPGYLAARWYPTLIGTMAPGGAINNSQCRLHPWMPRRRVTISDLGTLVVTGAAGNCQMAIWASDPATWKPTGLPLGYTAANLPTTTSGTYPSGAMNTNVTCEPGVLYWLGFATDQTTAAFGWVAAAWENMALSLGGANISDYLAAAGTSTSYFTYAHTFANGLNALNITPASVTEVAPSTTQRAVMIHVKTANPTP